YEVENGLTLVHIDAYRLTSPEDFENLLIDEIAPSPRCVCVEWWSNIADCVPSDAYEVSMSIEEDSRHRIKIRRGIS
ncbi:MAG: tRNA (adenosine(37)-N6)-threonylcarbamoyltransferase complex ATPase subunit type 1 TsaE, partial [Opitutales bacterium]|nr:tRNA (adenosine(37)-N6)-threonylcarbamoyltransferase complex ATPase subunit type 1 TsaE [Opitutales bacterium]